MMYLDCVGTMKKTFNEVKREDIGYEAHDFYHEELDDKGYEWIAGYVLEEETRQKLYEVWIKNVEQVAYEMCDD